MKETGTEYWNSPNTGADNESGFTARGGGLRYGGDGTYNHKKNSAWFWLDTSSGGNAYYYRYLLKSGANFNEADIIPDGGGYGQNYGFSVRCLED